MSVIDLSNSLIAFNHHIFYIRGDSMKLSEISLKDVINDQDGVRLGKVTDLEIDIATGKVLTLTISKGFKLSQLFTKENLEIPWNKIIKIGNDVVIVEKDQTKDK